MKVCRAMTIGLLCKRFKKELRILLCSLHLVLPHSHCTYIVVPDID